MKISFKKIKLGMRIVLLCSLLTALCSLSCENPFFPDRQGSGSNSFTEEIGMEFIKMPPTGSALSFTMGQTGVATPTRTVTFTSGFKMSKTEVTQGQWEAVMGYDDRMAAVNSGTNYGRGANYPMYYVSWYDAIVFCNKLSIMEGLSPAYRISGCTTADNWGSVPTSWDASSPWNSVEIVSGSTGYRLPTEAQWEYACRAGTQTAYSYGDTENGNYMWYLGNNTTDGYPSGSKPVGTKLANPWGLNDMHGNVYEWCWDWDGTYGEVEPWLTDPTGAPSGSGRVWRGGYWGPSAGNCRSAHRDGGNPSSRGYSIGFRVLCP